LCERAIPRNDREVHAGMIGREPVERGEQTRIFMLNIDTRGKPYVCGPLGSWKGLPVAGLPVPAGKSPPFPPRLPPGEKSPPRSAPFTAVPGLCPVSAAHVFPQVPLNAMTRKTNPANPRATPPTSLCPTCSSPLVHVQERERQSRED
jgi:hypothetical protein